MGLQERGRLRGCTPSQNIRGRTPQVNRMPRSTPQRKPNSSKLSRPRGRPRLEDVSAIDEKLVTIALREFQHEGYGATSMNAIARAAHVSKTTLYSRFPS